MANIQSFLDKISGARYGKDVRSSIVNALDAVNKETENAVQTVEEAARLASNAVLKADEATINANNATALANEAATNANNAAQNATLENIAQMNETVAQNTENIAQMNEIVEQMKNGEDITRGTLTAGETKIQLEVGVITDDSVFTFYTSIYGVCPSSVDLMVVLDAYRDIVTGEIIKTQHGMLTLTFKAQEEDMEVGVKVNG